MKATLDLPDDLYRRIQARSAEEGRPVQSVAVQLFNNWLNEPLPVAGKLVAAELTPAERESAPWLEITGRYVSYRSHHEMEDIRSAVAEGWAGEIASKLSLTDPRQ